MIAKHIFSVDSCGLSNVPLACDCDGTYVSFPMKDNPKVLGVWNLQSLALNPMVLTGHHKHIRSLVFSKSHCPKLLCSVADDYVIVWDVLRAQSDFLALCQVKGRVIGSGLCNVQCVTFNADDSYIAICSHCCVHILHPQMEKTEFVLVGHDGPVTCAEFSSRDLSVLITASEDRTFKVWDVVDGCLLYKSSIVSSSSFISISFNKQLATFTLGTTDGQVRVYDLTAERGYRQLCQISLPKILHQKRSEKAQNTTLPDFIGAAEINSKPAWQQHQQRRPAVVSGDDDNMTEVSCAVLSLHYTTGSDVTYSRDKAGTTSCLLENPDHDRIDEAKITSKLLVGTPSGVFIINTKTMECLHFIDVLEPIATDDDVTDHVMCVNTAGSYAFGPSHLDHQYWCLVTSLFQAKTHVISLTPPPSPPSLSAGAAIVVGGADGGLSSGAGHISVLSSAPLTSTSPLRAELRPKPESDKQHTTVKLSCGGSGNKMAGSLDKQGKITDNQPLVYHTSIKSSGYGSEPPRRTMFRPQINSVRTKTKELKPERTQESNGSPLSRQQDEYGSCADPPIHVLATINVDVCPCAVNRIRFRGDGEYLACALSNFTTQVYKLPLTANKVTNHVGHTDPITGLHWSHDNRWLVTSSDKCACVYLCDRKEPLLKIDRIRHNFNSNKETTKPSKDNPLFGREVRCAQFYFMDKFVLLSCGNMIHLYKYHLNTSKSDLKRYESSSRYKLVTSLAMAGSQTITAFSAVNSFNSYIVVCSGSDKCVQIMDMNIGRCVRTMPDLHSRAIYAVVQNEGGAYCSRPSSTYDLFLTAAGADCIKLWDLRSNRCVQRYESHVTRGYPCGLTFSPCGTYIATGADDKSAYVYDLRQGSGSYLHKLTVKADIATDVTFNPRIYEMVISGNDGQLTTYI